ncbi:ADP-ribosylation factor-related protein 1 isoform X2 [Aphelenchoides bicaudatus]|nr:ADP-ribosylation factor-related protein 1 isoform X2 [Aphelenchoides bicaudatus]
MFALGTGLFKEIIRKDEYYVLVCGPEASGKTTFAEQFRAQCDSKFTMSRRTTIVKFNVDGFVLNLWDVGGNKDLLSIWDRYIEDCHAIIFIVDSCGSEESYELCLQALNKVMTFEQARKVPLMILFNKCDLFDVHLPLSQSASSVQDEEMDTTSKQGSSSTTTNKSELNGIDEGKSFDCIFCNYWVCQKNTQGNGWTSQDDAEYETYKAYGWEQPDFVPPMNTRTPSQCSILTASSTESRGNRKQKQEGVSRAQRLQQLKDACQNLCEQFHRVDNAVFSISALKSVNIERCRRWLTQQLLTFATPLSP